MTLRGADDEATFDVLNKDTHRWGLWASQRNSIEDAIVYERHIELLQALADGRRVLH
jgi:hypothetical protein